MRGTHLLRPVKRLEINLLISITFKELIKSKRDRILDLQVHKVISKRKDHKPDGALKNLVLTNVTSQEQISGTKHYQILQRALLKKN